MQQKSASFSLLGQAMAHDKKINIIEGYLETISSCMPGNFYWKDKEGHYLGCNKTILEVIGFQDKADFIGRTDDELWPEQAEQLKANDRQVMESGMPINFEESVFLGVKGTLYFTVVKVPLRNENGDIVGIIGNSLDITESKKMQVALQEAKEQAEAASQAKSEFIANMSHDIRTPLVGLLGMAKEITHQSKEPEIKTYAQYIATASERLLNLLNEILSAAQYVLGHSLEKQQTFNIQELLQSIQELFIPSMQQKKLRFSVDCDPSIPNELLGNITCLHRILLNLLSNAIKFTPRGGITLSAQWTKAATGNTFVRFVIADTGIGIEQTKLATVFEPFTRLNPAYEGTYQGAGLGLYIVKQFLDSVGGTIEVTSAPNQGSIFTVHFPVKKLQTPLPVTHDVMDNEEIETMKKQRPNILVVEDDFLAGKIAIMLLDRLDCNTSLAISGKAALQQVKEKNFDLIYMDIGLPDHDGCEVTRLIRAWEQEMGQTQPMIIALTAHMDETGQKQCLAAGMDGFLQKPLTEALVEQHLQRLGYSSANSF